MGNDFSRVLEENCLKVEDLNINIHKLGFKFSSKPLLIGRKAMEYYQIRQAGGDIDFVVTKEDYEQLAYKYPSCIREIYDDFGVCKYEFEVWKSICLFEYEFLSENAIETEEFFIITFEKLMFLKVLAMRQPKCLIDLELIRDRMAEINTMLQDFF